MNILKVENNITDFFLNKINTSINVKATGVCKINGWFASQKEDRNLINVLNNFGLFSIILMRTKWTISCV